MHHLAERLQQLGLSTCAMPLSTLTDALAQARHHLDADPRAAARALLGAYYVVRLASASIATAITLDALRPTPG